MNKVKICKVCGRTNEEVEFKPSRNLCVDCYKLRQKTWYEENKEEILASDKAEYNATPVETRFSSRLHSIYGKSRVWFEKLLELQKYKCAICGADKPGGKGFWHLDHNHGTGECRGFLCHQCNLGIGHLKENEETLLSAIRYLNDPPSRTLGEDVWKTSPATEKKCGKCEKTRDLEDFHKSENGALGRTAWCKDCMRVYRADDHVKNRDRDLAYNKEWHRKRGAGQLETNYEEVPSEIN